MARPHPAWKAAGSTRTGHAARSGIAVSVSRQRADCGRSGLSLSNPVGDAAHRSARGSATMSLVAERVSFPSTSGPRLAGLVDPPQGTVRGWGVFSHGFTLGKDSPA